MRHLRAVAKTVRRGGPSQEVLEAFELALACCESLERDLAGADLESQRKQKDADLQAAEWDHLFEVMPAACLEVTPSGHIVHANRAAALLLNTSSKHLTGRLLLYFAEDRERCESFIERLAVPEEHPPLSCAIRPRERAPLTVAFRSVQRSVEGPTTSLVFITPATAEPAVRQRAGRTTAAAAAMNANDSPGSREDAPDQGRS